ncbi:hypothetical protein [Nannocystis pusilla]|uniref:hypothetical protein n=1 Tax=Nannocystis pusilla TaxID=889268 RepID=UPI003B7EC8AE
MSSAAAGTVKVWRRRRPSGAVAGSIGVASPGPSPNGACPSDQVVSSKPTTFQSPSMAVCSGCQRQVALAGTSAVGTGPPPVSLSPVAPLGSAVVGSGGGRPGPPEVRESSPSLVV